MRRPIAYVIWLVIFGRALVLADEPTPALSDKPQWQRMLQGEDAKRAAELQKRISAAEQSDHYDEAITLHEELLALRRAAQGADHWEVMDQTWNLDATRTVAALPAERRAAWRKAVHGLSEVRKLYAKGQYAKAQPLLREFRRQCEQIFGEKHPATASSYHNLADNLNDQGNYGDALPLFQKALDLNRELLGEKHRATAASYYNVAVILNSLGKYADALPLYQKALDLNREVLGEKHPALATIYNSLANNLNAQARYADAIPVLQKVLDLNHELLGEKHQVTAQSYNNLAYNLNAQGKYADASPLYQKALDLRRELLGDKHPETASSYNNVAMNLVDQGKFADALPLLRKALALNRELLGEKHRATAQSYNNLAFTLDALKGYADALPLYQKALNLNRELQGEKHRDTATSYENLAGHLDAQGKYADAQPLHQKALDLRRELLGEMHHATADSYNNLAINLKAQGKCADALPMFWKGLEFNRELLGEQHPNTAASYLNLAATLNAIGNYADAALLLVKAASSYEAARLSFARRGLDRAIFGAKHSPYRLLAVTQARLASPVAAWGAAETDLARGLSDENAARHSVKLTADEQDRHATLTSRLDGLQPLILQLVSKQSPTGDEEDELRKLQHDRSTLETELAELAVALSQRELATLAQVQAAVPADGALVLCIDDSDFSGRFQEHWGCVVRHSGDPTWERLPGAGEEGKWTNDDFACPRNFIAAVAGNASAAEIAKLTEKLYSQRIAPLEKHLDGVRRLFVVPVNAMAGVPVDVLTDKYIVSYVPSGTFLARLNDSRRRGLKPTPREVPNGSSLLALGDPVFPPVETPKDIPLPPGGLLITQVFPGGNAAKARLRPNDVLLTYAGADLTSVEQLGKLIQRHDRDKTIAVTAWRDGETADRVLPAGALHAAFDREPAPKAITARRKADELLLALPRGGDWAELPGSAVEVARLTKLIGDTRTTVLTRSAASEQELERLRADGKLVKFRYLHFATHGEPNNARSFESALILSQDQITGDIPRLGEKYYDGRLTANEVLENWRLNADLVTLSACESALGRPGGGDGVLGFAQAFLLAGSRSVCLSLWKVDDTATALLMERFYQNLLGKRAELANPLPKAAALAEAKQWLRQLSVQEATRLAADMTAGVARGKNEPALKLVVPAADPRTAADDEHPFSHPRYWAAFILIGDPD
ncbi:MAG TPA: tetratricopeptide repeat protein [Pirellulales bacterium]|nr:tetratricopeptide repeat protein [Pirellulales bacterium]